MIDGASYVRTVPLTGSPIGVAAALAALSSADHVVYERPGEIDWVEDDGASVTAYRDGAELVVGTVRRWFPAVGEPLTAVRRALGAVPWTRWRAYGWALFELSHVVHRSADIDPATPLLHLTLPRRGIRLGADGATLVAPDAAGLASLEDRLHAAEATESGSPADGPDTTATEIATAGAREYRDAVEAAVGRIRAGELDKVILSRCVPVPVDIDLARTFRLGRGANSPARSFLLRLAGWEIAGFSPEIVLTVSPTGEATVQPLAGTRARDGHDERDGARRRELRTCAKEVYEHAISVRLADDELSGVCTPGSVRIGPFMSVRERGSVLHLGSEVHGRLTPGRDGWDAFAAVFPAVTASGVPKAEACALIRTSERDDRGPYSGAVLSVGSDGTLDAALVLRSVFRHAGRTWLRAGAGIVSASTPERELEETREKLLSVSRYLIPSRFPT